MSQPHPGQEPYYDSAAVNGGVESPYQPPYSNRPGYGRQMPDYSRGHQQYPPQGYSAAQGDRRPQYPRQPQYRHPYPGYPRPYGSQPYPYHDMGYPQQYDPRMAYQPAYPQAAPYPPQQSQYPPRAPYQQTLQYPQQPYPQQSQYPPRQSYQQPTGYDAPSEMTYGARIPGPVKGGGLQDMQSWVIGGVLVFILLAIVAVAAIMGTNREVVGTAINNDSTVVEEVVVESDVPQLIDTSYAGR